MSANPPTGAVPVSDGTSRAQAERAGQPFLVYQDGGNRQQFFFFAPGSTGATVGRQAPADLLLDWDNQVSRLHARFEWGPDGWELVDAGLSSNGSFINEQRVSGRGRLSDGDTLRFGATTIVFRSPARNQSGAADPAKTPASAAVSLSTTQRRVLVALCRPYKGAGGFASPASDQQIADELFLSVGAVKTHLRVLYAKLDIEELRQNEMRVHLVERAFSAGLISERDL